VSGGSTSAALSGSARGLEGLLLGRAGVFGASEMAAGTLVGSAVIPAPVSSPKPLSAPDISKAQ
jgi:hypothetical protein